LNPLLRTATDRFPAGDEPLLRTATDLFRDQTLGLATAHVELVHRGLSQNEKIIKIAKFNRNTAKKSH
jgi:hypothetical protein